MVSAPLPPLRFGPFVLDAAAGRLLRDDAPVALQPKVFALLCALAGHPGRLIAKATLLQQVWPAQVVSDAVVKTAINQLRIALGDDPSQPRYVETVPRRGYRFIAGIEGATVAPPAWVQQAGDRMVGRQAALDALHAAWQQTREGTAQLVFVIGEAGIGKTTLIDHFARHAGAVLVARGQCVEQGGQDEPHMPILEALNGLCRSHPGAVPRIRRIAPTWLAQMPWHASEAERLALRQEIDGVGPGRVLREFREMLDRLAEPQPILLVLEDLQWSDLPSLQLIEHLASRRERARWMLVASLRPADAQGRPTAVADLHARLRLRGLARGLELAAFSAGEVAEYLAGRYARQPPSTHLAQRLHAQTGGLPLYLATWLDAADREHADTQDGPVGPPPDAFAEPPARLAQGLAHLIERQLELLEPEDQSLLEAASVLGVEFWSQPLASMLERSRLSVRAQIDRLARQGQWLVPLAVERLADDSFDARHAFRHALHRHVLYQRLGAARRAELHRRAAQGLEAMAPLGLPVAAAELAEHHERSHDATAAIRHSAEATRLAVARFAPQEAVRLARRALALLGRSDALPPPERDALELGLHAHQAVAFAQYLGFAAPEREVSLARALELCERRPAAAAHGWIHGGLGWIHMARADYRQALRMAERVEALGRRFDDPAVVVCAMNLRGTTLSFQGDYAAAASCLREGLAICARDEARIAGAPFPIDPVVSMLANSALPLVMVGEIDIALQHLARARERALRLGAPMASMLAAWGASTAGAALGEAALVAEMLPTLQAAAGADDIGQAEGPALWFDGWIAGHGPRRPAQSATQRIRAALERHRQRGMFAGASQVHLYAAEVALRAGQLDEARAEIDAGLHSAEQFGEAGHLSDIHRLDARWHAAQHDDAESRRALERALHHGVAQQSAWAALAAWIELCERPDAREAERAGLSRALAQVRGGESLARVQRARSLLQR
ncbi:Transcriptional regulatory protein, C terminal [Variovorax sp. PDC80]|nr:Transcriptional regulatory protein, C terminal [Variovorax sp. PDC80]